jgi:hypothetical protein
MKKYVGNEPGYGWKDSHQLDDGEMKWSIYTRMTDPELRWLAVKVVACGYAVNKANYWLSWDRHKNKLISRNQDATLLKKNRRELYDDLVETLAYAYRPRVMPKTTRF